MRTKKIKIGKGKYETTVMPGPQAQVALVVLDPHTGAVLALVGGRDYGLSQLNHAVAKRPTGSIFKPFVYAAAMNTALDGSTDGDHSGVDGDGAPSSFAYGDQIYEPRNYKEEYHGDVTLRYALAMSLNNATVKVAEEVGYDKVADLAKVGRNRLGESDAGNGAGILRCSAGRHGGRLHDIREQRRCGFLRYFVNSVRNAKGDVVANFKTDQRQVLDPRIAYVMTNMLEGVINNGLGYTAVRLHGFTASGGRKDGNFARWLVRGIYLEFTVHRVGGL